MTKIDIVIPNLNGEKYLNKTLESIRNLTEKPHRIIFSDNHSDDNSINIAKSFNFENIDFFKPPIRLNMSAHWNFAISNSEADWIILLSNDDLIHRKLIKILHRDIRKFPKSGAICYRAQFIDSNGRIVVGKFSIGRTKQVSGVDFVSDNLFHLKLNVAALAINISQWKNVGGFPEQYDYLHDLVFFQKLAQNTMIVKSRRVLGKYRVYPNFPISDHRKAQTRADFILYLERDLNKLLEIYPKLNSALPRGNMNDYYSLAPEKSKILVRFILFAMTFVRRIIQIVKESFSKSAHPFAD